MHAFRNIYVHAQINVCRNIYNLGWSEQTKMWSFEKQQRPKVA